MMLWARGKSLALAAAGVALGLATWGRAALAAEPAGAAVSARSHGKRVSLERGDLKHRSARDGAKTAARAPAAHDAKKRDGDPKKRGADPKRREAAPKKRASTSGQMLARHAKPKAPCLHDPVEIVHGLSAEAESVVLTRCDGGVAPHAAMALSILARPMSAPRPAVPATKVRHPAPAPGKEWAPGVKLVDDGLAVRLQRIADKFPHRRLTIVSGYRPASTGSFHQSAKAIDLRVDGVKNEDLVAFCRTMPDTGCGYYPNSSFVHVDVRAPRTGHVYWIDASGPGESPRYVATWPIKEETGHALDIPRPDPAAPVDENTNPEAASPQLPPGASDARVDATTTEPDEAMPPSSADMAPAQSP